MKKKYWKDALFTKGKQICVGEVMTDGLLVRFEIGQTPLMKLLAQRPCNGKVWWFNETKDREIAELQTGKLVVANPQLLWQSGWDIIS